MYSYLVGLDTELLVLSLHQFQSLSVGAPKAPGADPEFLERGGHMYKGVGGCFADFISFFFNIP